MEREAVKKQVAAGEALLEKVLRRAADARVHFSPENRPHVVVLGAGPAGLGAAYQLARQGVARVTVLDQAEIVGGNAASFEWEGFRADYGSHRLHPACDPLILRDLRALLGEDLLDRPRHGRIRLGERWLHFPLKPVDLALHAPKSFAFGVGMDLVRKMLPKPAPAEETFATVLERGLGPTICREFYFPYAVKLWGLEPEELAVTQAQRRVSGNSIGKILRKVAGMAPGLKKPGTGRFFYPRHGYGQISTALHEAARKQGAEFLLGARVTAIELEEQRVIGVRYTRGGEEQVIRPDWVWTTLPISPFVRGMQPAPPAEVLEATSCLGFRGMILIYIVLEQDQFTEYDAHYFPERELPISRLSEPKNYSLATEPRGQTLLCAELPCDPGEALWEKSDAELGQLLVEWLGQAGLPVRSRLLKATTRKLRQAYPVYRRGYEKHFGVMDEWLSGLQGLVHYGRQALFAHDNTHHALYMAYAAVDCFAPDGTFDEERWTMYRRIFETHVVED
ncbi:MAG: FAD-dependent oxidoreductase [Acidobacteria bacterium]|nr:FAD-dependent oxidoreductase [Acidobacteriota bacterium]